MRSAAAEPVYEGHRLLLVRPDLHVVWRGHGRLPDPGTLAALATGHGGGAGLAASGAADAPAAKEMR
jgi:hypothetical protein